MTEEQAKALIERFAEKQQGGHFACPRWGRMTMDAESVTRNALSRRSTVYVCDACGTQEALEDMMDSRTPLTDWAIAAAPESWGIKRHYTATEWAKEQYTDRWDDYPYFRDMVAQGEIPADYIGRRTVMTYEVGKGTVLLTEGYHFTIDDEEGRALQQKTPAAKAPYQCGGWRCPICKTTVTLTDKDEAPGYCYKCPTCGEVTGADEWEEVQRSAID